MTRSELLTPSVSKCPSPLELRFPLRERFCGFLESKVERLENRKLSHSKWPLSSRATKGDDDGGIIS